MSVPASWETRAVRLHWSAKRNPVIWQSGQVVQDPLSAAFFVVRGLGIHMSHAMALCVAEERRDLINGGGSGDSDRLGVADPRRPPSVKVARRGIRLAECDGNKMPRGRGLAGRAARL